MLTGDKGFKVIDERLNGLGLSHAGIVLIDPRIAKLPYIIARSVIRLTEKYDYWPMLFKNTVFPL
jgi:hypothetical protein